MKTWTACPLTSASPAPVSTVATLNLPSQPGQQTLVRCGPAKKVLDRQAPDVVDPQPIPAAVEQGGLCLGIVVAKCPESPEVGGMDPAGVLDLEGLKPQFSVDHEVDFGAGACAPEEQVRVVPGIRRPGTEMLSHQPFERLPVYFLGTVQRSLGA